jgi:type II secretory pathway component GspD/PulD (secretin)
VVWAFLITLFVLVPASASSGDLKTPRDTEICLSRAEDFVQHGRFAEAIGILQEGLLSAPRGAPRIRLLLLLGHAGLDSGDLTRADQAIGEARRLVNAQAVDPSWSQEVQALEERLRSMAQGPALASDSSLISVPAGASDAPAPGTLITNSFFDTDIREVLKNLSMDAGIPIVWDASVEGMVTFEAREQPLEQVLTAVLIPLGYSFCLRDGSYYVGSAKPDSPAFGILSQTDVVTLSNLQADEVLGLLSDGFKNYVKASPTSNTICITAPPTLLERIRSDVLALDAPQKLIVIEVIVTEIATQALRETGLDWSFSRPAGDPSWEVSTGLSPSDSPTLIGDLADEGVMIGGHHVDVLAALRLLVSSGKAEIRASPRIATLNGHTAQISLTRDQYFIIQTGGGVTFQYNTLQSVSSGIRLEITPFASPDGEVTVLVKPEVGDVVGKGSNDLPEISRRTVSTSVRVHDGDTFTIGGLSLQQEKSVQRKVPILGSIPLLGYLFRYEQKETRESELVIFLTPHIL